MTKIIRCAAVAAALLAAPVAMAETTPEAAPPAAAAPTVLKTGALLVSSDGKRVGRIERVVKGTDGAPLSASVIFDSRIVYVPASTIAAAERGYSTSLTRAQVRALK